MRFPIVGFEGFLDPDTEEGGLADDMVGAGVVIWTTTPWTIPSNRGIAYDLDRTSMVYSLYEVIEVPENSSARVGERLVVGDTLAEDFQRKSNVRLDFVRGLRRDELNGVICAHPFRHLAGADGFWDYDVPLLPADFVTDDAGTGFVHTAPSHGADDYELFVKNGLVDRMTHNVTED